MAAVAPPVGRAGRMNLADPQGDSGWASTRSRLRVVARVRWAALPSCALGVWSMATRKPSPRNRATRPAAEDLESRQLLSATASGTDIDGDTWTLRLIGPGSLTVVKQNGVDGNPAPLNSTTEINQIIVGGTHPLVSRPIGTVHKGSNGDGKVFFNTFNQLENHSERFSAGLGLLAINMPNFWLGNTTPAGSTTTPTTPAITIPDGTDTLRFGGVDTKHNQTNPPA